VSACRASVRHRAMTSTFVRSEFGFRNKPSESSNEISGDVSHLRATFRLRDAPMLDKHQRKQRELDLSSSSAERKRKPSSQSNAGMCGLRRHFSSRSFRFCREAVEGNRSSCSKRLPSARSGACAVQLVERHEPQPTEMSFRLKTVDSPTEG
jgi:hypothetical protein